MELKLSCSNWRKSKTMRKCQKPLNSSGRNMGPYAGQGTLERGHGLQRQGSGRMSDTICQSSGSPLHPNPSFSPGPQGQTLRKHCRRRCRCLSGSRGEAWPRVPWVTPVFGHCRLGCAPTDCTVIKCTCGIPYPWGPSGSKSLREQNVVVIAGQPNSELRAWKSF